jgi:cytoskeletal protein CcmA (bactofilin family)
MGDLVAPGIAIEDGAYFKGSIEILREESRPASIAPISSQNESEIA